MFSPTRKIIILSLLLSLLFAAGMVRLFLLRFEAGNVYPAYSSLRSDPLGTRALYESIERLPQSTVDRNFRPWRQVAMDGDTTLAVIGLDHIDIWRKSDDIEQVLDKVSDTGGRLVMTFSAYSGPQPSANKDENDDSVVKENGAEEETSVDKAEDDGTSSEGDESSGLSETAEKAVKKIKEKLDLAEEEDEDFASLLGVNIKYLREDFSEEIAFRRAGGPDYLPADIIWRSSLYFDLLDDAWETVYAWQDSPVVIRRPWGQGTVVMVADSYLLSNEALRNHRATGFLAWLTEHGKRIVFDEFHKGLAKQPSIAALTRQYRLHWVVAALVVVAGLFIWRQSIVFVPQARTEKDPSHQWSAVGRDTSQGVVDLARKHIGPGQLLTICFQSWKTQAAQRVSEAQVREVAELVKNAANASDKTLQVQTYQQICELLKQGRRS